VADAKILHKSYGDQSGELGSPNGRLLATTTQIAYSRPEETGQNGSSVLLDAAT
jgi:hypothetical protein